MARNGTDGAAQRAKDEAFADARAAAEGGVPGSLASMAEKVGATAGVRTVFGEPVEKEGRTVIPVAQSIWGSGAASGTSDAEGSGSGAGGGALTRPMGYIEVTGQGAAFVPLAKPWQDAKLVIAWAIAIWIVSRALDRILRG